MLLNNIDENLAKEYSKVYSNNEKPEGMFDLKPAIPFIGEKYTSTKPKVLSYASAENLGYAYDSQLLPNDSEIHKLTGIEQICRAKYFYKKNSDSKLPYVHIAPFNNGSQLLITRHILTKLGNDNIFSNDPFDFINQISVSNPGKFSIARNTNSDYANKPERMKLSIEYIKRDLAHLKPDIIIIPKSVFSTINKIERWGSILSGAGLKNIKFVLIYQLSFFNNHRVKKQAGVIEMKNNYPYVEWLNIMECGKLNMESHFTWIDKECFDIVEISG